MRVPGLTGFGLVAVVAALLAGCDTVPRTEIVVVVDTDLDVPGEIDEVAIDVVSPDGVTKTSAGSLDDRTDLPATLGVVHEEGSLGPYEFRATGRLGDVDVVARSASVSFVREKTLVLTMHLVRDCLGRTCDQGETCTEFGCTDVARSDLPTWDGTPPRLQTPDGDADADTDVDGDADADTDVDGDTDADTDSDTDADVEQDADPDEDVCVPTEEVCNGRDDDCDTLIDEDTDLETDEANCGDCGHVCDFQHGTGECLGGECTVTGCDPDFENCDDVGDNGCEADLLNDPEHCNACDIACTVTHGTGECVGGACGIASCDLGFEDCDAAVEGCETDLTTSIDDCGACDTPCVIDFGTGQCVASECTVLSCTPGYDDCNTNPIDGCEIDLNTDADNCGRCFRGCTGRDICCSGSCQRTCP